MLPFAMFFAGETHGAIATFSTNGLAATRQLIDLAANATRVFCGKLFIIPPDCAVSLALDLPSLGPS